MLKEKKQISNQTSIVSSVIATVLHKNISFTLTIWAGVAQSLFGKEVVGYTNYQGQVANVPELSVSNS